MERQREGNSETLARAGGSGTSKPPPERVFFIVDRSRLKEETDEFKDAVVVYIPDGDLKKANLEQRCSQLIGISILMLNFTSKMPKFIQLKSNGFAIRSLGDTSYIMGLQSKFDEPKTSVMHYLDRIHDFFMFSYFSAKKVMEMSQSDWEIFTIQMTTIFQSIMDFIFCETHTLPSMFNPLPYVSLDTERGGTRLFLQAHRLLRNIQLKKSVIGGCIFYNGELLCSQLPPAIAEKLLFIANGGVDLNRRSVLDDGETPESVWVIEVFITPEELAILHQIQRPHQELSTLYNSFVSNPDVATSVFVHERITHKDRKKFEVAPLYRADSGGSADFVTISYGSDSVSFARHSTVSPLKRPRSNRRFSHSHEEDYSEILPNDDEAPPPLPPKPGPPPVPTRHSVKLRPVPPPRTTSTGKSQPEDDNDDGGDKVTKSLPASAPVSTGKEWLYGDGTLPDAPVSPAVYGTPSASFIEEEETHNDSHDSDASDGFGTPSSTSPVPNGQLLSTSDTLTVSQAFLTPLMTSLADNPNSSSSEPDATNKPNINIYATLERSDEYFINNGTGEGVSEKESDETAADVPIDDDQQAGSHNSSSLASSTSNGVDATGSESVADKSVKLPEIDDVKEFIDFNEEADPSIVHNHFENEDSHSLQDASPIPPDVNESASEYEDQLGEMDDNFPKNMMRPRAETWAKSFTGVVDDEASMAKRAASLERKTVYIQKCVNTVLVVVTDPQLPNDHTLVQSLWKNALGHLLCINNDIQSCLMEKDSLYVTGEALRTDGPKTYQAMYSGLTGNCEVSSSTAPYQFRHAVRRAHQEYLSDPSLRQLSLCKEYCRMFCQNIMGRESYLHNTRAAQSADSFVMHSILERQAKVMRKQYAYEQNNTEYSNAPNLSFL